jgi:hypothetical protein
MQRPSQHARASPGFGFCGIMFPFGKPVAEPSSNAIQAVVSHGPVALSIPDFSTADSALQSCSSDRRDRTRFNPFSTMKFGR